MSRRFLVASFACAFFAIPLYPGFIALSPAPVPGVAVVPLALTRALFAASAVLAAIWLAALPAAPRARMPTVVPFASLPAAAALAALLGFDPRAGLAFIAILAFGVVWHAAVLRFTADAGAIRAIVAAFLASAALAALIAIAMVVTRSPASLYTIGHGRAVGTFVLPGELAGYLIVAVPVALGVIRSPLRLRALASVAALAGGVAFIMTFSRAGWIGLAAAIATMILLQRRGTGTRYAIGIVAAACIAVALIFNSHHDPSENFTRLSIWEAALRMIVPFPLAGVGPFLFPAMYAIVRVPGGEPVAYHAHSIPLTIAAETGLAGIAAAAWAWVAFARDLRARLRAPSATSGVAVALAAGLAGTWVQGLVDTVSVVIFALWPSVSALALVCAGDAVPVSSSFAHRPSRARRARRVAVAATIVIAFLAAVLQTASAALLGAYAAPASLPAHLPHAFGVAVYRAIARAAPVPFVETLLAEDALRRGDTREAAARAQRLERGVQRDELLARVARAEGREDDAIAGFIAAGDDRAVRGDVARLVASGRLRDALALQRRVCDRLAGDETRPNALADASWRLGTLAHALGDETEAARDLDRAAALAPLNTTYLRAAGELALRRGDRRAAAGYFARAVAADPGDGESARMLRATR